MSRKPTLADLLNDLTYRTIYHRLKNLALNIFEWDGLPEGLAPEFIEETLYYHGRALFFKDPNLGFLCLKALPTEGINVYGRHTKYRGTGYNYSEEYTLDESVLVKNNMLWTNTDDNITLYAVKLAEIERTLDVNVKAQKTPYIIVCDDKDLLTFKNIYKQVDGNEPAVFADKNLNMNSLDVLSTVAPFIADQLADYRHDVMNEILSFLGIDNANTDKRERLVTDEVTANNEYIENNVLLMLKTRERAVEEINKMFPELTVSVKLKEKEKEVEEDGELHPGSEGDTKGE